MRTSRAMRRRHVPLVSLPIDQEDTMPSPIATDRAGYATIVVPLDGSNLCVSALPIATAIARASHGTLHLARVHAPIIATVDVGFPVPHWEEEIRESEHRYLAAVSEKVSTDREVRADSHLLDGPVGRAIKDLVVKLAANLVVITTHGRTGLSRAWLGSTADWLVRFAPVPVLLVRPPDEPTAPDVSLTHVLVALDGSERAERIVPEAIRFARLVGARLTLVRVVPPVAGSIGSHGALHARNEQRTMAVMRHAKDYLDGIARAFHREIGDLAVATEVVASERTAEAILERATTLGAGVIALSTRGRGASRLLVGSVADKVLRGFTGAVLALGPVAVKEMETDEIVLEAESTAAWH
jgi:nucleotide-binding universal stress UspA family protein